jgi:DNA transposition AAA+ family ATPase
MNGDGVTRYWGEAQRRGMSLRAAAKAAGLDGSVLCRALKGVWAGDMDRVESACLQALDVMEGGGIFETSVTRGCRTACSAVAIAREIGLIWGPLQCGKTTALKTYVRDNRAACYCRVASRSGTPILAEEMAKALGSSKAERATFRENRRYILDSAAERTLIVDELHEAFSTHGFEAAVAYIEFIREVHDRTGCGVILCGTDAMPRGFQAKRYAPVLRQTWERGIVRKTFPALPPWKDVLAAAAHYGASEELAEKSADAWKVKLRGMSFGAVCRLLRSAAHMAGKRGRPMCWERVGEALATLDQFAAAE